MIYGLWNRSNRESDIFWETRYTEGDGTEESFVVRRKLRMTNLFHTGSMKTDARGKLGLLRYV